MDARTHLMNRLSDSGGSENVHPLVTLEEFFTENNDQTSIGTSGSRDFRPLDFFSVLSQLRTLDEVSDIRVELNSPKIPGGWPSTDTIWIVTSLTRSDLPRRGLTPEFWERFLPDDWLSFPRIDGRRTERLEIPDGMRALGFWYH